MNNESIPEGAKMEEGMIASTGVPTGSATNSVASATDKRLSTVSKMYDTSGKGELDEVQLAMRNMDQTGRGYLTNDKVYGLMQEQIKMQKSMFQMKKIIIGLLVFVVILALSNLGTSFASAILAKDATTNDHDELVSKHTKEVLATGTSVEVFEGIAPDDVNARKLQCQTITGGGQPYLLCDSYSSDFTMMTDANAHSMLEACKKGNKVVKMTYTFGEGDKTKTIDRAICNPSWNCANVYEGPTKNPTSGELCVGMDGADTPDTVYVVPHVTIRGMYTVSSSEKSVATTDAFTSNAGEECDEDENCDSGLFCETTDLIAVVDPMNPDMTCTAPEDCSSGGTGLGCYNGYCGYCDEKAATSTCVSGSSHPVCTSYGGVSATTCGCDSNDDCATGETCGTASCEESPLKFCSTNHDADRLCKVCAALPTVGMSCTFDSTEDPTTVCAEGLFCQISEGFCAADFVQASGICADPSAAFSSCPATPNNSCVQGCDGVIYNNADCAQAASMNVLAQSGCFVE